MGLRHFQEKLVHFAIKPGIANQKAQIIIEPVPEEVNGIETMSDEELNDQLFG